MARLDRHRSMVLNEAYGDVLIGPLPPSIMGKYWLSAGDRPRAVLSRGLSHIVPSFSSYFTLLDAPSNFVSRAVREGVRGS